MSDRLAVLHEDGRFVFFNPAGPIFSCRDTDRFRIRLGSAMLTRELRLCRPAAMAAVLGVHRGSVCRNGKKLADHGADALRRRRRPGPRGAHKLTADKLPRAQALLDQGLSYRDVGEALGVVDGTIRHAIKKGRLHRPAASSPRPRRTEPAWVGPRVRSEQDAVAGAGVAVHRHEDRALAAVGKLAEATPVFEPAEAVQGAGVLVALPALLHQGLIAEGLKTYGALRHGFFGLKAVLLVMAFIALLRIRTFEQLSKRWPGELGRVLGLDRAPEVKTLRRKLEELAERGAAATFAAALTKRWAASDSEGLGLLYVDGHVRVYHGQKYSLPKRFVQRRRTCMPGTTDVWVNDAAADPLFVVTAPATEGLLAMLDDQILPHVRDLVGPTRRVTVVFDREGWSPKSFEKWSRQDFDILTYRKGTYEDWPRARFVDCTVHVAGTDVVYRLAEDELPLTKTFAVREVRRLCDNGHQTSVVTTRRDLEVHEVAVRMFSRWTQENFFRYMRQEYALDHTPTYAVDAEDGARTVPNPDVAALRNELKALRTKLAKAEQAYGVAALENPEPVRPSMRGFKIAHGELGREIRQLRAACADLRTTLKSLPDRVPLKDLKKPGDLVKLEVERKVLTDQVKMIAYRAESALFRTLSPLLARRDDEGRAFLAAVFQTPADLLPDAAAGTLTVRIHGLATPRANAALGALCDLATDERITFPGTTLRMVFEGPGVTLEY